MREVIERRRDGGDADGVREKSRDRDEEQNVTRTVTVRSCHEMIRVDDQRVCRQYDSDRLLYPLAIPEASDASGATRNIQHPYPRNVPCMLPESTLGTCQSHGDGGGGGTDGG